MNRCRHFLVSGMVQGVFYRTSAQATASGLGLTGWVRNLPDGRVELVACGDEAGLRKLERWLWQGPSYARVEQVDVSDTEPKTFAGFTMR